MNTQEFAAVQAQFNTLIDSMTDEVPISIYGKKEWVELNKKFARKKQRALKREAMWAKIKSRIKLF